MRHSQEEKAKTHQRIVQTASRLFREKGFDGIGPADLMKEAGVTVRGFYKHFKSKDALIQEAMADATQPPPCTQTSIDRHTEFVDLLSFYLGLDHKDDPGTGCSFAALSSEMRRCDPETRALLTARLAGTMDTLTEWLGGGKGSPTKSHIRLFLNAWSRFIRKNGRRRKVFRRDYRISATVSGKIRH